MKESPAPPQIAGLKQIFGFQPHMPNLGHYVFRMSTIWVNTSPRIGQNEARLGHAFINGSPSS